MAKSKGKTEVVQTRVSADVEARLRAAAELSGMTFSEWVRNTLELEADSVLPPAGSGDPMLPPLPDEFRNEVDVPAIAETLASLPKPADPVEATARILADLPNTSGGSMWSCPTCAKNGRPRRNYAKDEECSCGTKRPKGA